MAQNAHHLARDTVVVVTESRLLTDVARRLAAFGALTRMTGTDSLVTLDDGGLTLDDGEHYVRIERTDGGPLRSPDGPVPAGWRTDETTERLAVDWIEDYLEDTYQALVIRRDDITDLIADPFSQLHLERLARRFPAADLPALREFLGTVAAWLGAPAVG